MYIPSSLINVSTVTSGHLDFTAEKKHSNVCASSLSEIAHAIGCPVLVLKCNALHHNVIILSHMYAYTLTIMKLISYNKTDQLEAVLSGFMC